jgi:hypothetical protein
MKSSSNVEGAPVIERNAGQPCYGTGSANGGTDTLSRNGSSRQNGQSTNRINVTVWLSAKEAACKLSCSTDTIERRAIPWQENAVRYKIRFKFLVLDEGGEPTRRYFEPDLEALLIAPSVLPMPSRKRLIPRFVRAAPAVT